MDGDQSLPDAPAVARCFLYLALREPGVEALTQRHLHAFVYLAQGWMLTTHETPLCLAHFVAGERGPVEVQMRTEFARYGAAAIPACEAVESATVPQFDRGMIRSVWYGYRDETAAALEAMARAEAPWRDARTGARGDAGCEPMICERAMFTCFRARQDAQLRAGGWDPDRMRNSMRQARRGETLEFPLPRRAD